ncbi:MAG: N-acetylornithine carbamoyltransferase [Myxococcales bacterium]|nr:N-acetylornithine carbamoyltransferase [Myxococcales bacterium]MCB9670625.1 N-acetylornithine carbamoyltransferase [Alphaproteobacteria bacterium]
MSLLDGTEPGADGVRALVQRAVELRSGAAPRQFPGRSVGAVFFNPSLRTRTSLEAACARLGAHPICIHPGTDAWAWEMTSGAVMDGATAEHIDEAVPVLASYVDVLAVRSFARLTDAAEDRADPVLAGFVARSKVPVVNLESAMWHPLQGLADTATWSEKLGPDLTGRRLVLTWAPHPRALPAAVPNQVLLSAALMGMDVTVAHPEGFDLDPDVVARASALAAAGGGGVTVRHDREALADAEVVVAKSWSGFSGYADRDGEARRRAGLASWRVDAADLPASAGFMHCLPVRRNVVVADAVLDGPGSWVQLEAAYRLWTAAAVLESLLGDGW